MVKSAFWPKTFYRFDTAALCSTRCRLTISPSWSWAPSFSSSRMIMNDSYFAQLAAAIPRKKWYTCVYIYTYIYIHTVYIGTYDIQGNRLIRRPWKGRWFHFDDFVLVDRKRGICDESVTWVHQIQPTSWLGCGFGGFAEAKWQFILVFFQKHIGFGRFRPVHACACPRVCCKLREKVKSVASRACCKLLQKLRSVAALASRYIKTVLQAAWEVKSVASRPCCKLLEKVKIVASRASCKLLEKVESVASRACCNLLEKFKSVASSTCPAWHERYCMLLPSHPTPPNPSPWRDASLA